jgi:hypothetical protein
MPYFYDPNLDEQNQNNQTSNGNSVSLSGASSTYNADGSAGQPNNNKDLNTGSGFQNLDKYLQTNDSQKFGNQFLGKVSDQVQGAKSQMNQASEQFKNQVQSSNQVPSQEQINNAIANPAGTNAQDYQKWMNQSYSGPKDLAESQDTWNKYWSGVNQAQTNTQLMGKESGRFTLLDQYFGRPTYNYGEKGLDNLLFQQSGLGSQTKQLQDQATMLKTEGNSKAQELQGLASQKAGDVEKSRTAALNAIGLNADKTVKTGQDAGALGQAYQQVYDQVNSANTARSAQQNAMLNSLSNRSLTQSQLEELGLLGAPTELYNLNLTNYLNKGGELSRDQVMSPEQRARIQALSQLAGIDDTFANGTAKNQDSIYGFDSNRFIADQRAQDAAYKTAYDQLIQKQSQDSIDNFPIFSSQDRINQFLDAQKKELEDFNANYGKNNVLQVTNPLDAYRATQVNKNPSINSPRGGSVIKYR